MRGRLEDGARKRDRGQELGEIAERLVAVAKKSGDVGPIVRASAVSLMAGYGTQSTYDATLAALKDREPLVRLAAARNLQAFHGVTTGTRWEFNELPPEDAEQLSRTFGRLRNLAAPLLKDPIRAVRFEAARALAAVPPGLVDEGERETLATVLAEFRAGCLDSGDQAASHAMLAELAGSQGRLDAAEREYRLAMVRLADFIPARTGLAEIYRHQKKPVEAEKLLREALSIVKKLSDDDRRRRPQEAELYYQWGLLAASTPAAGTSPAESSRLGEASSLLGRAVRLAPDHTRARFALATVLRDMGELDAAESEYLRTYEQFPWLADYRGGLVSIYQMQLDRLSQRQRWREALPYAQKLVYLVPGDRRLAAQLGEIEQKAK